MADRTGEKKKIDGQRPSIVWRLKPSFVESLSRGQEEASKEIDAPAAKRRKRDRGMDYAKAFRK